MTTLTWPSTPAWDVLASAVSPLVSALLSQLWQPLPQTLELRIGTPGAALWATPAPGVLTLHEALAGPEVHVLQDAALGARGLGALALDRWRRTVGAIAEGAVVHGLAADLGRPAAALARDWWVRGRAADLVDRADPALGWSWAPAVDLLQRPQASLLDHPRRALWVVRWLRAEGRPTDGPAPTLGLGDWLRFGRWVRDRRRGPAASLPVPVDRCAPVPVDALEGLEPWSHCPVRLAGCPAGRRYTWTGSVAPGRARVGHTDRVTLLASLAGGEVGVSSVDAGPVGTWILTSGNVAGQVGAARGVELCLAASGAASLTGADAFLGPPTAGALDMASQMGVSGESTGTWACLDVDTDGARGTLTLAGLADGAATVHGRGGGGFHLPADAWLAPVRTFLGAVSGEVLRWRRDEARLTLSGRVGGMAVELRFDAG